MFGKFDSPNKKKRKWQAPKPHNYNILFSGQQRDPNGNTTSRGLFTSAWKWSLLGDTCKPNSANPATDDGNPATWMIYEAETKRNSPQWKFSIHCNEDFEKMTGFKLPTKITFIKYQ